MVRDKVMPLFLSMMRLRSAGKLSYLAWFIAKTNPAVNKEGRLASTSVWNLLTSCNLKEGIISQAVKKPSTVPLVMASATAGMGMPTGVAPKRASNLLDWRLAARIFKPLKSSMARTGLLEVLIKPSSCTQVAKILVPGNSLVAYLL